MAEKEQSEKFKFKAEKEVREKYFVLKEALKLKNCCVLQVHEALDHIVTVYNVSPTRQRQIEKTKETVEQPPHYTKQQIKQQLGKHSRHLVLDLNTWDALDEQKSVTVQTLNGTVLLLIHLTSKRKGE